MPPLPRRGMSYPKANVGLVKQLERREVRLPDGRYLIYYTAVRKA